MGISLLLSTLFSVHFLKKKLVLFTYRITFVAVKKYRILKIQKHLHVEENTYSISILSYLETQKCKNKVDFKKYLQMSYLRRMVD